MDLDGRTCLVTGANRGIGLGIARASAEWPVRLPAGARELASHLPKVVLDSLSGRAFDRT